MNSYVKSSATSYFSIIDDDAQSVSAIGNIEELAEKKGIKISFAVKAEHILRKPDICFQLLKYQEIGHQIINHSLSHSKRVWMNPQKNVVEQEFIRSKNILDSLGFYNSDYFVFPWGNFSSEVRNWMLPLVAKHFKLAFNSRGGANELDNYNRYYIYRFPLRKHDNLSIVKYEIDRAVAKGKWIVFLTHSGMSRDFDSDYVGEVVDYCLLHGMKCVTVHEAYGILRDGNQLREDKTHDWTWWNEICSLLYMHLVWVLVAIFSVSLCFVFLKYIMKEML